MLHIIKSFYYYFIWLLFSDRKGIVSEQLYLQRLSICKGCDQYRKQTMQCKSCKCFMFMKAKVSTGNCPLGKWQPLVREWGSELFSNIPDR